MLVAPVAHAATASGLLRAAEQGDSAKVAHALSDGGAVTRKDRRGRTALWYATAQGHGGIVSQLLAGGADPSVVDDSGEFPVLLAARHGDTGILEQLIAAGADVDAVTREGETALMAAILADRAASVAVLIDAGADVNARAKDGRSAADLMRQKKNVAIGKLLAAADATTFEPSVHDRRRVSLERIRFNEGHVAVIGDSLVLQAFFIVSRADTATRFTVSDSSGRAVFETALHIPIDPPFFETTWDGRTRSGAFVPTGDYTLALDLAGGGRLTWMGRIVRLRDATFGDVAREGTARHVKAVAARTDSVDATDDLGRTALMWAAVYGNVLTAYSLLELGADVFALDSEGKSVMHHAIRHSGLVPELTALLRMRMSGRIIQR